MILLYVVSAIVCVGFVLDPRFVMWSLLSFLALQELVALFFNCILAVVPLSVLCVFPPQYLCVNVTFLGHTCIFGSPEPKAQGELIVWDSSRRPSVRASVLQSTLSNMNISETSRPTIIKFHQKHHWGGGLTALGFG